MIIKFGITVVGARGTAGGLIFSANQSGPFARLWSKGANQRSAAQSTQRRILGTLASEWRGLSTAQKDDWKDYADDPPQEKTNSLGETYFASGFNWYVTINQNLIAAGEAQRVDAPTLTRPVAPIIVFAFLDDAPAPGRAIIGMSAASPGLASNHVVHARLVNSQGITVIPLIMPFMLLAVPDGSRNLTFSTPLTDRFGTVALGQRLLASVVVQDAHGQRGPEDTALTDTV